MQLKFVKWDSEIPKSADPEEEEEFAFDASDYMYKLLALVLSDYLTTEPKGDLNKFIASLSADKVIKDKRAKIEDADELWANIKSEVGAEHSALIIPILKGE
jgi:hypothetical protein